MNVINKFTGAKPTEEEVAAIRQRAMEIFANPYASPEQQDWAMEVYPEGFAGLFPFESYHHGRLELAVYHLLIEQPGE